MPFFLLHTLLVVALGYSRPGVSLLIRDFKSKKLLPICPLMIFETIFYRASLHFAIQLKCASTCTEITAYSNTTRMWGKILVRIPFLDFARVKCDGTYLSKGYIDRSVKIKCHDQNHCSECFQRHGIRILCPGNLIMIENMK